MKRKWFADYDAAISYAEQTNGVVQQESLESVGHDNREPGWFVYPKRVKGK